MRRCFNSTSRKKAYELKILGQKYFGQLRDIEDDHFRTEPLNQQAIQLRSNLQIHDSNEEAIDNTTIR